MAVPLRFASFRRLQKCTVEVLALSIPTRYVVISATAWDRILAFGKFVCQCIVVAPACLAEVPLLNRFAQNRRSKSWWNNKSGSML